MKTMDNVHRTEHAQALRETLTEIAKRASKGAHDEEAHKRIDELEKTLAELPEKLLAVVMPHILSAIPRPVNLEELLATALRELVIALRAPTVRTGTVELPSGPVTLTTTEMRQ